MHIDPDTDPAYVATQVGKVIEVSLTKDPIEEMLANAKSQTATPAMGAVVTFEGIVRDHDQGQRVASLKYSAHPSAQAVLEKIANQLIKDFPNIRLWSAHRVGVLEVGELAFSVIVASAHRQAAFHAMTNFVDRVKAEVPIWKEQELVTGHMTWVGIE